MAFYNVLNDFATGTNSNPSMFTASGTGNTNLGNPPGYKFTKQTILAYGCQLAYAGVANNGYAVAFAQLLFGNSASVQWVYPRGQTSANLNLPRILLIGTSAKTFAFFVGPQNPRDAAWYANWPDSGPFHYNFNNVCGPASRQVYASQCRFQNSLRDYVHPQGTMSLSGGPLPGILGTFATFVGTGTPFSAQPTSWSSNSICFAGHGVGAAIMMGCLATWFCNAAQLQTGNKAGHNLVSLATCDVTTFGMPKCGDTQFNAFMNDKFSIWNLYNDQDPIAYMPFPNASISMSVNGRVSASSPSIMSTMRPTGTLTATGQVEGVRSPEFSLRPTPASDTANFPVFSGPGDIPQLSAWTTPGTPEEYVRRLILVDVEGAETTRQNVLGAIISSLSAGLATSYTLAANSQATAAASTGLRSTPFALLVSNTVDAVQASLSSYAASAATNSPGRAASAICAVSGGQVVAVGVPPSLTGTPALFYTTTVPNLTGGVIQTSVGSGYDSAPFAQVVPAPGDPPPSGKAPGGGEVALTSSMYGTVFSAGGTDVNSLWTSVGSYTLPPQIIVYGKSGTGYSTSNPPTVLFSGGGGTGAAGVAIIVGGSVVGIRLTNQGSNYTAAPTITILASSSLLPTVSIGQSTIAVASGAAAQQIVFQFTPSGRRSVVGNAYKGYVRRVLGTVRNCIRAAQRRDLLLDGGRSRVPSNSIPMIPWQDEDSWNLILQHVESLLAVKQAVSSQRR